MNRSYRSIWNESLGAWVAAAEVTKACGKSSGGAVRVMAPLLALAASISAIWPSDALAAVPSGPGYSCITSATPGAITPPATTPSYPVGSVWTCTVTKNNGATATISGVPTDSTNTGPDITTFNSGAGAQGSPDHRRTVAGQRPGLVRAAAGQRANRAATRPEPP